MAATNFTPIILYHTTTASAAPTAGNLNNGELAINITDGKLFYKDNGGTVQVIATKGTGTIGGSNTQVQYNSSGALAGSANFTFNGTTATINTLNLTNALGTAYGGTALTTYTQGDLVYASAANTLAKLGIGANTYILTSTGSVPQWSAPSAVTVATANNLAGGAAGSVPYQSGASTTTFLSIGSAGQVLTSSGTAPQWSNLSSLGVTSLSFGTTGLTPSSATQGAITVAGTLATTNGGTGLTSFTANGVMYASSASALATGSALTFDGTTFTYQSAISLINNDGSGNKALVTPFAYGGSGATGTLVLSSTYGNANQQRIRVGVGGAAAISFDIDSAEGARLTSTGLGIGTSSPVDRLTIVKSTVDGASTATFINSGTPTTTTQSFRLRLGSFAGFIANPQLSPYVESLCTDVGNGYSALAFGTYGSSGVVERGRFSSDGTFRVKGAGTAGSTDAVQFSGAAPASSLFLDSTGSFGVGALPISKLEVRSGYITAGTSSSTNGSKILAGYYTSGALSTWGSEYSNGSAVMGYGVWPSTAATGAFVSSTPINVFRGAYMVSGNQHIWYGGGAQAVAIDSAVSMSELGRFDASGRFLVGTTSNFGGAGQFAIDQSGGGIPAIHLIGTQGVGGGGRETGAIFSVVTNDTGPAYGNVAKISAAKENATQGNTAGYMAFQTTPNGGVLTERARISSAGLMGVGITNPGQRLSVLGTANASYNAASGINVDHQSSSTAVTVPIGFSWSSSIGGQGSYWGMGLIPVTFASGSADLGFYTQASEKMRITAGGLILLGANTSQGNGSRLQVSGSMQMFGSQGANGLLNQISSFNTNSSGFEVAKMEFYTGANIYEGQILFSTKDSGGTMAERARITSAGNFLVGTQSLTVGRVNVAKGAASGLQYVLAVTAEQTTGFDRGAAIAFPVSESSTTTLAYIGTRVDKGAAGDNAQAIVFGTNQTNSAPVEKARITSDGQLLVGTTTIYNSSVNSGTYAWSAASGNGGEGGFVFRNSSTSTSSDPNPVLVLYKGSTTTTSAQRFIQFYADSTAQPMGGIVGNGATNVQFVSLSDAREKENIQPVTGALARVCSINVVSFDRKGSGDHVKAGFIAQNVLPVYPEYVVENASDSDSDPRYGITGGMSAGYIAELTAAIQELKAEFDAYKATHP